MADNNFKGTVEALFTGIDGVVSSKTVVGDAIHIGDTIILPLVDVSFAIGAGAFNADKKEKLEEFLRDEVHKGAYHKCKKELFRLMKHLKPKKADVRIIYGFDDPYHTGQALAVFGVLYPFVGGCISVTPDFEHQVLKGSAYLKGKIYLWHFVQSGWKLIRNRNVRQTYRDIRNFKIK